MYGYLVKGAEFHLTDEHGNPTDPADLAAAIRVHSSIQVAASRKNTDEELVNLVRGPHCLASLVNREYQKLAPLKADGKPNAQRQRFARCLAIAVGEFMELHYGLAIRPPTEEAVKGGR